MPSLIYMLFKCVLKKPALLLVVSCIFSAEREGSYYNTDSGCTANYGVSPVRCLVGIGKVSMVEI